MHPSSFEYRRPTSLDEALRHLAEDGARPLAGGHSLLPVMKRRLAAPGLLVDIGRVPDLSGIATSNGTLTIGATTTHAEVAGSGAVKERVPLLAAAAAMIGDMQVRNRGTIGGSLAHADPAADLPAVLTALGATITVKGPDGERTIAASDFFTDLFETALHDGELVTSVSVPAQGDGRKGAYLKHRHPASSYAVVGVAALATVDGGDLSDVRVVVGGATSIPVDASGAFGSVGNADEIEAAASSVGDLITDPIGDVYASGEFRAHLASVLAKRALGSLAAG